jgi:thioredoxin 1
MKILTLFIFCFVSVALADNFTTIDGKEYKNVKVRRVEPDGIVLATSSGIWKVYFNELPPKVQERFHYDSAKATAYSDQQAASQEAFRKQQEELQRRRTEELQKHEQDRLHVAAAFAPDRGQPIEVITHGAQVDITQHLALGNVTIVDFYADWCGPCRRVSPSLEQMAQTDGEIALRKVDIVDWSSAVARQYHITSIPRVEVYGRNGQLVGTVKGANTEHVKQYVAMAKGR